MPRGTDRFNEAALQQRLWNPRHLLIQSTASPIWFDASDLSTITTNASTNVFAWRNKFSTPISRDLSNSGNLNVRVSSSLLNGNTVVRFDSTQLMTMPQTYNANGTSYFIVLMREVESNITPMIDGSSNYPYLHYGSTWVYGNGNNITVAMSSKVWYLGSSVSGERYWNGQFVGGSIQSGQDVLFRTIGSSFSIVAWNLAELLVLEKVASQYERQLIEGYLAWKWGIQLAANHPYVNRPPLIGD